MNRLEKAAQIALFECLELQARQSLLLVSHAKQSPIVQVFRKVAEKARLEVFFLELPNAHPKGFLLNLLAQNLINAADNVLMLAPQMDAESLNWLRQQTRSRIVLWPHLEEETITRCAGTDQKRLRERCRKLSDILTIGRTLTITTASGTHLEMSIHQRKGMIEALPLNSEQYCTSLPSGRAFVMPASNSVNGELFLNTVAGQRASTGAPLSMKLVDSRITMIKGGKNADILRRRLRSHSVTGESSKGSGKSGEGRHMVEIGFGMNENAKLGQSELEDEKVLGTAHLGFGRRTPAGKTPEIFGRGIIVDPDVTIDGRVIIQNGKLMFE